MSSDKKVVITSYGQGVTTDRISVTLFDSVKGAGAARAYCDAINTLDQKGDEWVSAHIVPESFPIMLCDLRILPFAPLIISLDDNSIERLMREIDGIDLVKALIGSDSNVQKKIFRNVPRRAAGMLKEDIKLIRPVQEIEVKEAQRKIVDIFYKNFFYELEATDENAAPDIAPTDDQSLSANPTNPSPPSGEN